MKLARCIVGPSGVQQEVAIKRIDDLIPVGKAYEGGSAAYELGPDPVPTNTKIVATESIQW